MTYALVAAALGALCMLWLKFKSFFLAKKVANLTTEVKEAKDVANTKVQDANSAYNDFESNLVQYDKQKADTDK